MDTQKTAIAQRSQQKLYFEHRDMDYYLSWILGRQIYGGSEPETCFKAASHIVEGDPDSWQQAWAKQAQQIEARAETALGQGDFDSAKERYLQACTYYRAPLFIMSPKAATFWEYWHKMQVCFQTAAALFDPPVEAIQVPFQGNLLPGYLWPAARIGEHRGQQRPTLIIIGGLETFAEDGYFMVGQTSSERGYCAIAVDLPGQGMTPNNDLFFEARMGAAVKAVVDYALTRPEVDPDQLALFGFSWGGHIVFKGAEYDQRIKALIATPAMPDVFRAALAQQGQHGRGDRVGKAVFDQIAWRFGLKLSLKPRELWRRIAKAYDYLMHGKTQLSQIRCPTLCMAGEDEPQITLDITYECYAQLPNPLKKRVIFTRETGGEAHCQINNLMLLNRTIFDWLDQIFSPETESGIKSF